MGRQDGILQIKGEVGGMSFYKTTDGSLVRKKGGINKNRIMNDPAFQRTRENGQEFGKAGAAGKLLRSALSSLIKNAADNKMVSRLTKAMVRVLRVDAVHERGQRNIKDAYSQPTVRRYLNLLPHFAFLPQVQNYGRFTSILLKVAFA